MIPTNKTISHANKTSSWEKERLKNVKKLGDIMTPKAKFDSLLSSACLLFSENFSQKFLTKQVCIEVWQEGVCTYENVGTGTQLDRASIVLKADPKIVLRALEILLMGVEKRLLSRVHIRLDFANDIFFLFDILQWQYF